MKTRLRIRQVKECIVRNPTISSIEELCAVMNVELEKVRSEERKAAEIYIERNRLRMQVLLKQELYVSKDKKSHELLFKMICDKDELNRFGVFTKPGNVSGPTSTVVEIKSVDPDIVKKVKDL